MNARVNTGPYQFPGDWPGYFFRGDDAGALSHRLNGMASMDWSDEQQAESLKSALRRLATELAKCQVDLGGQPQQGAA